MFHYFFYYRHFRFCCQSKACINWKCICNSFTTNKCTFLYNIIHTFNDFYICIKINSTMLI